MSSFSLTDLRDLLDLERIEHDIFRGRSHDIGSGAVFGGQALAQALVAAARTVDADDGTPREVHSMHGYFILPGDVDAPIVYEVDRLRNGRSFTTRRIVAIQHGRAIFNMAASFQKPQEGHEHQDAMPEDVPGPESLKSELELLKEVEDRIPKRSRPFFMRERPIEFRPVSPANPFDPQEKAPVQAVWFRTRDDVDGGDAFPHRPLLQQSLLAYASDYGLLGTALRPHALSVIDPTLQVATLDHALWFHRPVQMDAWMLFAMESPSASGARGFTRGKIFAQDGTLVASVTQEGLMRRRDASE